MKALKVIISLVVVILIILLVRLPITTTPGFFIGGSATTVPTIWSDTSSTQEIELKVSGIPPRVVIIWFVEINNDFYIIGETDSGWVSMLGDGGPVLMRLRDSTYALQEGGNLKTPARTTRNCSNPDYRGLTVK